MNHNDIYFVPVFGEGLQVLFHKPSFYVALGKEILAVHALVHWVVVARQNSLLADLEPEIVVVVKIKVRIKVDLAPCSILLAG